MALNFNEALLAFWGILVQWITSKCGESKEKQRDGKRLREYQQNEREGEALPAEAVMANSQLTGGSVCCNIVAVICLREVLSKLV